MKGMLSKEFSEAEEDEADFVVLNTCGVVERTERKILKEAAELKKKGKKVVISGCLPSISPEACEKVADGMLGPADIASINDLVREMLKGKKITIIKDAGTDKAKMHSSKKRDDKKSCSAIVAISEGCLGGCSYCATKLARKKLESYGEESIISEIGEAVSKGYKEIQLTSQDLSIYGLDKGKQLLPELIKEIAKIDGGFKVKLGMMNPGYARKMLKELLSAYESEKIYKFIHLPLQSGDDGLLKKMNRGYAVKDFAEVATAFRKRFKDSIIATDIIVGHPLEDEKAFEQTIKAIEKIKPDIIHIFKFSKRKGTPDFKLKDLPDRIKKDRSRILTELFENMNLQKNKKLVGKIFEVLVVEKRKDKYLGRTGSGRAVALKEGKIGESRKTRIIDYRWNYLIGD
jgi:MiaB-like tRNA modifying enzyme